MLYTSLIFIMLFLEIHWKKPTFITRRTTIGTITIICFVLIRKDFFYQKDKNKNHKTTIKEKLSHINDLCFYFGIIP